MRFSLLLFQSRRTKLKHLMQQKLIFYSNISYIQIWHYYITLFFSIFFLVVVVVVVAVFLTVRY